MRQAQLLNVDLSNCEYNGKYFIMENLWLKQIIHIKEISPKAWQLQNDCQILSAPKYHVIESDLLIMFM